MPPDPKAIGPISKKHGLPGGNAPSAVTRRTKNATSSVSPTMYLLTSNIGVRQLSLMAFVLTLYALSSVGAAVPLPYSTSISVLTTHPSPQNSANVQNQNRHPRNLFREATAESAQEEENTLDLPGEKRTDSMKGSYTMTRAWAFADQDRLFDALKIAGDEVKQASAKKTTKITDESPKPPEYWFDKKIHTLGHTGLGGGLVKKAGVGKTIKIADESPMPPMQHGKELDYTKRSEYTLPNKDHSIRSAPNFASEANARTISEERMAAVTERIETLRAKANAGHLSIGDAINLAIHEEILRDPTTIIYAEGEGLSDDVPKSTQQTYDQSPTADDIKFNEGRFTGRALAEAMHGYQPIVDLMNSNFGIYGMAEISSAGNTHATPGGQLDVPKTTIGAVEYIPSAKSAKAFPKEIIATIAKLRIINRVTSGPHYKDPDQVVNSEHSHPFHAYSMYVMGIPGHKILTAAPYDSLSAGHRQPFHKYVMGATARPEAAYVITESMINGLFFVFVPGDRPPNIATKHGSRLTAGTAPSTLLESSFFDE